MCILCHSHYSNSHFKLLKLTIEAEDNATFIFHVTFICDGRLAFTLINYSILIYGRITHSRAGVHILYVTAYHLHF